MKDVILVSYSVDLNPRSAVCWFGILVHSRTGEDMSSRGRMTAKACEMRRFHRFEYIHTAYQHRQLLRRPAR